ncbi:hypothetical protein [Pedobacter cryotolerans]|uniref:Uncharacterized protein n=1 Tax=Pedobacter cryotolerans TaxID=2571270 RepID=A0A4U1C243_9SPHI|nr:hypothetical protein [Pedobacter cryotolerans]TKB98247.1 hypothetical protein FA045_14800 [Pedobacter cryotolerans]
MLKKNLICLIAIILLSVNTDKVLAATGCLYTSGYIYPNRSGNFTGNPPGTTYGNGSYENYSFNGRVLENDVYCVVESTVPCRIDGSNGVWGVKVTFSYVQCPIDDYIPLLITFISGVGLFYLKRKTTYMLA